MDTQTANLYIRDCPLNNKNFEHIGLRISSIFVMLAASMIGVLLPLVASRAKRLHLPYSVYFFARYFGSGVIFATSFIHLLFEAHENLSSPCLSNAFRKYPYAYGIALFSIFVTFLIELVTKFKIAENARKAGVSAPVHSHGPNALAAEGNNFNFCESKSHETDPTSLPRSNQNDLEIASFSGFTSDESKNDTTSEKKSEKQPTITTTTALVVDPIGKNQKLAAQISNICMLESRYRFSLNFCFSTAFFFLSLLELLE
jgi:hypothetical protein